MINFENLPTPSMPGRTPFLPTALGTRKILLSAYGDSKPENKISKPKEAGLQDLKQNSVTIDEDSKMTEKNSSPLSDSGKCQSEIPLKAAPSFLKVQEVDLPQQEDSQNNNENQLNASSLVEVENDKQKLSLEEHHEKSDKIDCNDEMFFLPSNKSAKNIKSNDALTSSTAVDQKRPGIMQNRSSLFSARLPSSINDDLSSSASNELNEDAFLPLEAAAAGLGPCFSVKDARKMELEARRKTKEKKKLTAEAKLAVTEARLDEFEAKLCTRQARIEERHASLCRKRAIIKRAEDRLLDLEIQFDKDEKTHRKREEKIRSRERKVKQEEIRIHTQEANLKKREEKIVDVLKEVERKKKIVEEKEIMSSIMTDVMGKKPDAGIDVALKNSTSIPTPKKTYLKLKNASTLDDAIRRKENKLRKLIASSNSTEQIASVISPSNSPTKPFEDSSSRPIFKRSSSFDSELILGDSHKYNQFNISSPPQPQPQPRPRPKSKAVMGLWL